MDNAPDRLDRPFLDPLFDRLFPKLASGVHWGLERVEQALAELGDPHRSAPALHIGGTNGKGSVASTLASAIRVSGRRVGLYTSPHLCSLTERFQVDGRPATPERLIEIADEIRPVVEARELTFFEAATVLAFTLFQREGVEMQVVEVGLGGRLDATNVLTPEVSILTNVAMDHADFLGPTPTDIAGEKAGILKPGVPAITSATDPDVLAVFRERAARVGAPLSELDPRAALTEVELEENHTSFVLDSAYWGRITVRTPLAGVHQAANAALAVEALGLLPDALRPTLGQVLAGVARVRWPGRDQIWLEGETHWLADVAHNTAGVLSLTQLLRQVELPHPRVALIGVLGDKEWDEMLPPLLRQVDAAVLTQPPSAPPARRWDPTEAAAKVAKVLQKEGPLAPGFLTVDPDFRSALERARERAGEGTVVVTGSCHTVGDAMRALEVEPFPEVSDSAGA